MRSGRNMLSVAAGHKGNPRNCLNSALLVAATC